MKRLYFVRHGLSVMNQQGIYSGQTETPLTSEGIEQSHTAGQELQAAGIDCIVASPIRRALDTAEIIAGEIGYDTNKIITNELFMERRFGPLEGTAYHADNDLDGTTGVEHSRDLIARVSAGLDFLKTLDADTILVVSHGAVGRALRHLLQPDVPFHKSQKFENAKVEKLL